MHNYTYLSMNKIDMLYDQISNLSGKEVSFSGEGSLLAVKGGVDVKTKITTTTQEKIDAIREELELEGSLGQIGSTRNEDYISYSLPTLSFSMPIYEIPGEEKIAVLWVTYDYDYETDTMYKVLMYGSKINLVSRDSSDKGGLSVHATLGRLLDLLSKREFEVDNIRPITKHFFKGIFDFEKDELTDLVDELFHRGIVQVDNKGKRKLSRMWAICEVMGMVYYRKRIEFKDNYYMEPDKDMIKADLKKCKHIEYIIGSPLYVDTGQLIIK